MPVTGRIHSIETFGTLDGPGIRFVAFLQGCSLRCLYCHNRDTWDMDGGMEYTPERLVKELTNYLDYIRFSGGGITLSGGEPTLQPDFAAEVFEACRLLGVHTALDTSGHVDPGTVKRLLASTDLVLLDIKHALDGRHREITGVGAEKARKFSKYLTEAGIPVWIRYVLVPGLTDSEQELLAARDLISSMGNVQRVEVLPYHCMGSYKWDKLGLSYPLAGVEPPTHKSLENAQRILLPNTP